MNKEHRNTIPTIDISSESHRHVIVAQGTTNHWQGHPSTLLLPDGKTMYCIWQARHDVEPAKEEQAVRPYLHGAPCGFLKRSDDGGLTWSDLLDVPPDWRRIGRGHPTIHRLVDAEGVARLILFCRDAERTTFLQAVSEDDGRSWSSLVPLPLSTPQIGSITGWTAPITIVESTGSDGSGKHLMWYERAHDAAPSPGVIWQSASNDGGLTWGESRPVVEAPGASEPAVIRSPDGKQLLMLIRQAAKEKKQIRSYFSLSDDEGQTWSDAESVPLALTGDRHLPRYAPTGELVVLFRPRVSPDDSDSHFVAWVGRYEDIVNGNEGVYRVKLLHSYAGWDHTYPGFEILPDGTLIGTTYIKYRPGPEMHSVVSVRFRLDELKGHAMANDRFHG